MPASPDPHSGDRFSPPRRRGRGIRVCCPRSPPPVAGGVCFDGSRLPPLTAGESPPPGRCVPSPRMSPGIGRRGGNAAGPAALTPPGPATSTRSPGVVVPVRSLRGGIRDSDTAQAQRRSFPRRCYALTLALSPISPIFLSPGGSDTRSPRRLTGSPGVCSPSLRPDAIPLAATVPPDPAPDRFTAGYPKPRRRGGKSPRREVQQLDGFPDPGHGGERYRNGETSRSPPVVAPRPFPFHLPPGDRGTP